MARMQRGLPTKRDIPNVKTIVAVSSAKGGVGKSTIAVNVALALARTGHRTGLLDTDIFGPSIPTLMNLRDAQTRLTQSNLLTPLTNYGVQTMSIGYLVPPTSALSWRGLLTTRALHQLLFATAWSPLDILILDLPPGTSDAVLTLAQTLRLAGAVVVSTPQDLSLADAVRGVAMFRDPGLAVPVLGLVQNMSVFACPACGERTHVFGADGVRSRARELGLRLLGDVPLDARICADADRGRPTVVAEPESERAEAFRGIAARVAEAVGLGAGRAEGAEGGGGEVSDA